MNATDKNGGSTLRNGKARIMVAMVMLAVGGSIDLVAIYGYATQQGQTYGPLDFIIGPLVVVMGVLQIALGPTAFRKRARWAWKILLIVPAGGLLNVVYDWFSYAPVPAVLLFFVYAGLGSLALLLTYRASFPFSWKHQEDLHPGRPSSIHSSLVTQ